MAIDTPIVPAQTAAAEHDDGSVLDDGPDRRGGISRAQLEAAARVSAAAVAVAYPKRNIAGLTE